MCGYVVKAYFCESQNGFEDSGLRYVIGSAVPDVLKDHNAFVFRVKQFDTEDEATAFLRNVGDCSSNDMPLTHQETWILSRTAVRTSLLLS